MTVQGWLLILTFAAIIVAPAKPVGAWLFALYEGRETLLHKVLGPVERGLYRIAGIDPAAEQSWRRYAVHMLLFQPALLLFSYAILRLQHVLPLNPRELAPQGPDLALNTAVSFTTNTNWQSYSGETLSIFSNMMGLTIHNFLSAATGIAIAFALFRGFSRREAATVGNFWADCTRVTLYLLLPILAAMMVLFLTGAGITYWQEAAGNPVLHQLGVAGGNMEGKEVRFGIAASALFSVVTTAASCGAVNAMHDSFTALGGMIPLLNMQLGEIVVGGVGAGIYGFLLFALLAVFVAGLMVGRTPEYVGKKIEAREVKLAVLAIAVLPLCILGLTAVSTVMPDGLAGPLNKGPHGITEILYAYSSGTGNNGSAFAGLTANTPSG